MKKTILFILLAISALSIAYVSIKRSTAFKESPFFFPIEESKPQSEDHVYKIAVVGSGAAGIMALERAVLNNDEVLLFSGGIHNMRNSRGTFVRKVDNIPGLSPYKRTLINLRNNTLKELKEHSHLGHNLNFFKASVQKIERTPEGLFLLEDNKGRSYKVQYVVLATGIMDTQPIIGGTHKFILPYANSQAIAYCIRCDGHRAINKKTVIVGHGNSAAQIGIILKQRYAITELSILTHGKDPEWAAKDQDKLNQMGISILKSPIAEILGQKKEGILEGFRLGNGEIIGAEFGVVTLGIRPNNHLAKMLGADLDQRGLVITNDTCETNIPNLFVIGDLRANAMKQIYIGWTHGVIALDLINRRIRNAR